MDKTRFEERYRNGEIPWDHGMVDSNLVKTVSDRPIAPCRILDIGCGTGDNAIWLARHGFDVVACDISDTAIGLAREKAAKAGIDCRFLVADFLVDPVSDVPFACAFDRGCLHSISTAEERGIFIGRVADLLEEGGLWLSLVGNADEPEREVGPPQLSATELSGLVEPRFEILSLVSGFFGSDQLAPPRAWICLMRKRA